MKRFSILSIGLVVLGLLLFGLNAAMEGYSEPIVLLGFVSFVFGVILSFIAFAKQEEGNLKFISCISCFIVLFLITWFEPFQIFRIITWLKKSV
ncbi:hypothetical protein [Bacillus testis]|uniref:hypothetical protein n=1 Tax=Bacillus testis TaxID=1622072 RepID=UPI00067EC73A|nr:hypothetical protein [Bacillus testis]